MILLRAQTSAELLVLLAATAAFLAVVAPAARDAAEAARAGLVAKQQETALEKISGLAGAAALMRGSALETEIFLAADSEIEADGKEITLKFQIAGKEKGLEAEARGFKARKTALEKGAWVARAENGALSFERD